MSRKFVFSFKEGRKEDKELLGGKGANLAEMTNSGLPVPPGFTISTKGCNEYLKEDRLSEDMKKEIMDSIEELQRESGKIFGGDSGIPLLVSVRSGAAVSMPGMMDTVLNLGLNDENVKVLARESNNPRFAYESYMRFIQMFSDVVMEIPKYLFDNIVDDILEEKGYKERRELDVEDIKKIIEKYKDLYISQIRSEFPKDPRIQLIKTVEAVFKSWNNPRAIIYRGINGIDDSIGTAVNVQSMVFGNLGEDSGTGVAFTRNPSTGEKKIFGEYLMNAQGEDVVAGIRTPNKLEKLKEDLPSVYDEFIRICERLEGHYKDMQDIEFTIENGKLYLLQTRTGKRTPKASIKIAVDLVKEGFISEGEAVLKVDPNSIEKLLHKSFSREEIASKGAIGIGLPASPGAATGRVVFDAKDLIGDKKEILVAFETTPEDIEGMNIAEGVLTVHGGMTSHAAVVARGMGKCCVCGCQDIDLDIKEKKMKIGGVEVVEGEYISIDGSTGKVYKGELKKEDVELDENFEAFMGYVDRNKRLDIRANADTVEDVKRAFSFGAVGVGLCRTEHMFFDKDKIWHMRRMIVARNTKERNEALTKILTLQQRDFYEIFKVADGKPVNIRLLDPPLHEFLPKGEKEVEELARVSGLSVGEIREQVEHLQESNPMLGHRGCRLAVTYPEIYKMQGEAIIKAAIQIVEEGGSVSPEIMIPLVGSVEELKEVKEEVVEVVEAILKEERKDITYKVGTMIEVPRACLTAEKIAEEAEFFSFGTNDLTQITFGFSRDDSSKFIEEYKNKKILKEDPFKSIDTEGVGSLMKMAIKKGRDTRKDLKIGICGEHGGDPKSVEFCHNIGLDYVSCSPYRIPVAKVAAAQGAIKEKK